jgi:hypothetical protein
VCVIGKLPKHAGTAVQKLNEANRFLPPHIIAMLLFERLNIAQRPVKPNSTLGQ